MKIVIRLILAVAMLVLGIWLWTGLFPDPERIIRKRLTGVARSVSFAANEGNLARLASAQKLGSYFSPDVEIVFDAPGRGQHTLNGRDELMQAAMAVRSRASAL